MEENIRIEISRFGTGFIQDQILKLEDEIDGALAAEDIEYVHRMRVASRRLRTALGLFNNYLPENYANNWRDKMKGITRALGNARDLDIQIQLVDEKYHGDLNKKYQPGYARLLLRLQQKRAKAQEKVVRAINDLQENKILEEIQLVLKPFSTSEEFQFTTSLYTMAQKAVTGALEPFLSYQPFIETVENGKKLHEMRIAGKHLRYTMEIFSPLYEDALIPFIEKMKNIQDQLGSIHDCDVWITWLPAFIKQEQNRIQTYFGHTHPFGKLLPGLQHLADDRQEMRQKEYQAFLANWKRIILEQTWENLETRIHKTSPDQLGQVKLNY